MTRRFQLCFVMALAFLLSSCSTSTRKGNPKILIFSKTEGYHHKCIARGVQSITTLCKSNDIDVYSTETSDSFTEEELAQYAAVLFFNTTGDVLDHKHEAAFERYIQAGGGYVGIHAASDTEYKWAWYGELAGAYFVSHPKIQEAKFVVEDTVFQATNFLPSDWIRSDEIYNLNIVNEDVNVVLSVDETSYEGGTNGNEHPMAWYHEYDGGRAFYTALGHTEESYSEDLFMRHVLEGIRYAIGENKILDYSQATTQIAPDSDRFSKEPLSYGEFYEPTEMTILPNKDVLVAQRRGELMLYKADTKELKQAGFLDVYHETGIQDVNAEEGFMGLQRDPDFASNHWVYTFYSPKGEEWVNRLSRFKFIDDSLQMDSEQVILDVPSQRLICCHTGGSIAFGPGGLLYLSTGDNSTPFDDAEAQYVNEGFAPLNDLPGKEQYDARRSSGNTNDLRGKILRIKVNEDGSYDIPQGNLFEPGTPGTRPEIYTMGHRNPYRISVDPKNGYVYWGDVGPDSNEDRMDTRGPRGYDEMNQARGPGNFGWPFFIADNKAYRAYDYSNGQSGDAFDPAKPINNSKNNNGLTELPPAQPAYIYYPYEKSEVFSGLASGGRNAMAGPVFYADMYQSENSLPDAFDGKVFIYDWIRGWMKAVTLQENGTFNRFEPFAPAIKLNNLIDMELGPDGQLYLLEYGSGWFSKNDDSALSVVKYNGGNRPPVIANVSASTKSGKNPLAITFEVEARDPESENLSYHWYFGDGDSLKTSEALARHAYNEAGSYKMFVEVADSEGLRIRSETIHIVSGNSSPKIDVVIAGDADHFEVNKAIKYKIVVKDAEDGAEMDEDKLFVSVDYLEGFDEVGMNQGHQVVLDATLGESLIKEQICKTCHKPFEESIGPSYLEVANKYKDKDDIIAYLSNQIIKGSSGQWGENVMPANSDIDKGDLQKIIKYIMSLNEDNKANSLPAEGQIIPEEKHSEKVMVITVSYTDKGAEGAEPLTSIERISLTNGAGETNDE